MDDLISRQDFDKFLEDAEKEAVKNRKYVFASALNTIRGNLRNFPSTQPKSEERTAESAQNVPNEDLISRKAAIDAIMDICEECDSSYCGECRVNFPGLKDCKKVLEGLPSAQPERTCVNCGRTANNGGWYADGGTRCPIEEHYALPKDGYCHLWEKRNITDDDYPERRTDGRD